MSTATSLARRNNKKKIRVPKKPGAGENQFDDMWHRLSQAFREIYNKNAYALSFEELYRNAYNMVLQKMGERLYNGVKEVITEHLNEVTRIKILPAFSNVLTTGTHLTTSNTNPTASSTERSATSSTRMDMAARIDSGSRFLKVVQWEWEDHIQCMTMIKDILMYLDRVYVKSNGVPTVYDMGLDLFRDYVVHSPSYPVSSHLIQVFLDQIQIERDGELVDKMALKACTDMLLELVDTDSETSNSNSGRSIYTADLEYQYLESSSEFYRLEGQELIITCDASGYLKKVEKRLQEEEARIRNYLASSTEPKIRHIVEQELIAAHVKIIIEMDNSGIIAMVTNDKFKDIQRMYALLGRVEMGHDEMKAAIARYIQRLGKGINAQQEISSENRQEVNVENDGSKSSQKITSTAVALKWVQEVLDLKDKFDNVLRDALQGDKSFQQAFNQAFEVFINQNRRSSEFISLFIDENLKKGLKGKTEAEVDSVLDKTITLFRFIQEKDVFERYYKSHLARRLLLNRSVSDDAERGMIAKLKVECGYQFTSKLEGMFNDMKLSQDIMGGYKEHLEQIGAENRIDLNVTVLTSTFWPMNINTTPVCNFPLEMAKGCESFARYYLSRHSGRKVTWHPGMGSVDVRATFGNKRHELNVSTHAAVILLLFNDIPDEQTLSYEDIKASTLIADGDLVRNLQSLACAKYKVLLKSPKGRDVNTRDTFVFNAGFTAPLARLKIQTVASKVESEGEHKDTLEKVEEARKHQTEAAIVRIMKDRKKLDHNNLVSEVTKQLQSRFQPNPAIIKKRIEALIDREYIERSDDDRRSYIYLA